MSEANNAAERSGAKIEISVDPPRWESAERLAGLLAAGKVPTFENLADKHGQQNREASGPAGHEYANLGEVYLTSGGKVTLESRRYYPNPQDNKIYTDYLTLTLQDNTTEEDKEMANIHFKIVMDNSGETQCQIASISPLEAADSSFAAKLLDQLKELVTQINSSTNGPKITELSAVTVNPQLLLLLENANFELRSLDSNSVVTTDFLSQNFRIASVEPQPNALVLMPSDAYVENSEPKAVKASLRV